MMPKMTRAQFEAMTLEELLEWAYDNIDDIHSEETLIEMAKHEIDEENLQMAVHILNAVYESDCPDDSYYLYDRGMGTLETPTPITRKEDLEDYIDFDEEDEEELETDTLYHNCSEDELRKMGCFDNLNDDDYPFMTESEDI